MIEIKDDGVGLNREFTLENPTSFGWLMISNLMKQLEDTITVTTDGGTITIEEKTADRCLVLRVADDGIGFEVSNLTRVDGFGLFSIAERVSNQGGKMEVTSTPGACREELDEFVLATCNDQGRRGRP